MQRRQFIRRNLLGLVGLPFIKHLRTKHSGKKVVIIGAGMAGAAASRALKAAGFEVLVLEARNRVGGRIHTHTEWGYNLELGANWIHDSTASAQAIKELANQLRIDSKKTNYNDLEFYDLEGKRASKLAIARFYLKFNKIFREEAAIALTNKDDVSMQHIFDSIASKHDYSGKQLDVFALISEGMANNLGASLDKVSARYYLSNQALHAIDLFVTGGYQRMVAHCLENTDVRLNTIVREIRHENPGYVQVVTDDGVHDADYVIVTVPLSILQKEEIHFSPSLPDWKRQSFASMQMGCFNKVIMEFGKKFWKRDAAFTLHRSEMGNAFGVAVNYHHFNGRPVLIAMPVDAAALWVEQNPVDTVKRQWLEMLHRAYPGKEITFKNFMVTNWHADKYSQGSYSHVPVGSSHHARMALSKEVGRIHFAGEATEIAQHGTVHAAYQSGVREAMKVAIRP